MGGNSYALDSWAKVLPGIGTFSSPRIVDLSNDGIQDVIINGRSAELMTINGKSGELIWRFNVPKAEKNNGSIFIIPSLFLIKIMMVRKIY